MATADDVYINHMIADGMLTVSPQVGPDNRQFELKIEKAYAYKELKTHTFDYYYHNDDYNGVSGRGEKAKSTNTLFHPGTKEPILDYEEIPTNGYIDGNRKGFIICENSVTWQKDLCAFTVLLANEFQTQGLQIEKYYVNNGDKVKFEFYTSHAVKIDWSLPVGKLQVEFTSESSPMVPIGGIIMWDMHKEIPWGYHICDGSEGTLNLLNMFIRASTRVGPVPETVVTTVPGGNIYELVLIMRIK